MLHGYVINMVSGKAPRQILLNWGEDDFDDPGEFRRDDKDGEHFENQPDVNPIIVEEKPVFALHYVNFKRFIMMHQQPPLHLYDYDLEGSYLNLTQEGKNKQL